MLFCNSSYNKEHIDLFISRFDHMGPMGIGDTYQALDQPWSFLCFQLNLQSFIRSFTNHRLMF